MRLERGGGAHDVSAGIEGLALAVVLVLVLSKVLQLDRRVGAGPHKAGKLVDLVALVPGIDFRHIMNHLLLEIALSTGIVGKGKEEGDVEGIVGNTKSDGALGCSRDSYVREASREQLDRIIYPPRGKIVRFVTPSALPHGPTLSSTESHLHRIASAGVTVSAWGCPLSS